MEELSKACVVDQFIPKKKFYEKVNISNSIKEEFTDKLSRIYWRYKISEDTINIPAYYNKVTDKTITNKHKEGDLSIYKVDKDNHKVALGNVKFDLFSEEFNKVIGTYTTDVNGEIHIKNLRTGNYNVIEKNTGKW